MNDYFYLALALWLIPALSLSVIGVCQESFGDPWWMKPALVLFFLTWPISLILVLVGLTLKYHITKENENDR